MSVKAVAGVHVYVAICIGLLKNSDKESSVWEVNVRIESDAGVMVLDHCVSPSTNEVIVCFWVAGTTEGWVVGAQVY